MRLPSLHSSSASICLTSARLISLGPLTLFKAVTSRNRFQGTPHLSHSNPQEAIRAITSTMTPGGPDLVPICACCVMAFASMVPPLHFKKCPVWKINYIFTLPLLYLSPSPTQFLKTFTTPSEIHCSSSAKSSIFILQPLS